MGRDFSDVAQIRAIVRAEIAHALAGGGGGGGLTTLTGAPGVIVNSQVDAAAAIAWSKISKAGSNLTDLATIAIVNSMVDAAAAIAWSKLSKAGSSLADLGTRSAADLSSGIIPDARIPGLTTDGASVIRQISFPATQVASAGANVLDDYEEGVATITLNAASGSGATYSSNQFQYVKIGKFVWCSGQLSLTSKGTLSGLVTIGGLPFTSDGQNYPCTVPYWNGMATNFVNLLGFIGSGSTSFNLYGATAATGSVAQCQATDFNNNSTLMLLFCYRANA